MSSHDETQAPSERWSEIRDRHVIFENDHALVLNKLAGISVTGERHGWDIVSLADAAGEWIMPAHRIDKVTSGAVLFAKTIEAHGGLTRQFNRRTVDKGYLAITRTVGLPESGIIDLPLSEGRKKRVRVAAPRERIVADTSSHTWSVPRSEVFDNKRSYPSVSLFVRLWEGRRHTLLLVRPVTGRRHQIRVHLAWIGHPIMGDPLFAKDNGVHRTFLHSWRLDFDTSWGDGKRIEVEARPGPDFADVDDLPPVGDMVDRATIALVELPEPSPAIERE